MASIKRPSTSSDALIKRQRVEEEDGLQQMIVSSNGTSHKGALIQSVRRTSGLSAPIMALQGHSGEILDLKFSPDGESIASASADKTILLWNVYGDCKNYGMIRMPKGAPTSLCFVSNTTIVAGSTDNTVGLFNLKSGEIIRRFRGHSGIVNSVDVLKGRGLIVSGSDDGTVRVWQEDSKAEVEVVELGYPITAVKWSVDGQQIYIGGVDNDVHVFSLSAHAISYTLRGHADTITSLALSPTNSQLLSSSMDSVVHCWNVAPFAPQLNASNPTLHPRLVRSYLGAPAGFEGLLRKACWSQHATQDGSGASMVAIGGADRTLTIWDATTANIIYKLPGHTGTVISTDFSPKEPIVATGDVSGLIFLGEVEVK